jgi:hypothetical protein
MRIIVSALQIRRISPLVALALLAGSLQGADLRDGLVSYWPLDVNDAGATPDWGAGNTMSVTGSPLIEAGQFGNAFRFDGTTTYLSHRHSPDNFIAGLPIYRAGSYTITMWVKGAASPNRYLYTHASTNSNNPLLILQSGPATNNNKFDVIIRTDGNAAILNHVQSTNVVFDDTWHHIAWVDDRGSAKLYVDGNLDPANFNYTPSGTFTFNTAAIGTLIRAAVAGTGNWFNGSIDDVAVWERALTQAEVEQVRTSSLVTGPPYITRQPAGGTRGLGDRFTLRVGAIGAPPLSYEWYKGGEPVPDAASSFLTLSNLTPADGGDYTVRVTSGVDAVQSAVATVTVLPDPPSDLRNSLISYWPMDTIDTDGLGVNTTPDLYSQNNIRLMTAGFFDQAPGAFNSAIAFNGTTMDQYGVRMGGFPIYNNPAFTVSIWVNGGPQNARRFFSESTTNGNNNPLFTFGTDTNALGSRMQVFIRNNTGGVLAERYSTRPVLDSNWHHVVWIETNGQAKLYIDGQLDETDYNYAHVPLTLDQTSVAAIVRAPPTGAGNLFIGSLDEIAVWNRALTFTEIQEIRTNGIPAPIQAIPPEITQNPQSQSIFTPSKVAVTFSFAATGTSPLAVQWRKGGIAQTDQTNVTLVITNVGLSDAGDYDVVVSNSAGSVTSLVATLTVALRPAPASPLRIDFNNIAEEGPLDTEPGFATFAIVEFGASAVTRSIGGTDVTLAPIGTTMESRKRATPVNGGAFTQERLLRDFVFTRDAANDQGLDIRLEYLKPSQPYRVTIWSFDTGSSGTDRVSDWFAGGGMVQNAWAFNGATLPTTNDRYQFSFNAMTDANGDMLIQGRRSVSATVSLNVFINALQLTERELRIQRIELAEADALRITFEALDPTDIHQVDRKSNLNDPAWTPVDDAFFNAPNGNTIEVIVPTHGASMGFYRVQQAP